MGRNSGFVILRLLEDVQVISREGSEMLGRSRIGGS